MTNTTQDQIRTQFENLAQAAGLNMTKSYWDVDTYDSGVFTFATRRHALNFIAIIPDGYTGQLLGPTNSVDVEIVYPS